jgi:hypothetical protein
MTDRYIRCVLTVIAGALIYLCVVLTPITGVSAQTPSLRPGEPSGPTEVVVVGWRPSGPDPVPVTIQQTQPLRIEGTVNTERSTTRVADRVVIVGWETGGTREFQRPMTSITDSSRFPVALPPPAPPR